MSRLTEYFDEVVECIQELGAYGDEKARSLADEKRSDIEYGCKYRLNPSIVAGNILGINDCCISPMRISSETGLPG